MKPYKLDSEYAEDMHYELEEAVEAFKGSSHGDLLEKLQMYIFGLSVGACPKCKIVD